MNDYKSDLIFSMWTFAATLGMAAMLVCGVIFLELLRALPVIILATALGVCMILVTYTGCSMLYQRHKIKLLRKYQHDYFLIEPQPGRLQKIKRKLLKGD